jgi:hypothetical protein
MKCFTKDFEAGTGIRFPDVMLEEGDMCMVNFNINVCPYFHITKPTLHSPFSYLYFEWQ